MSDQARTWIRGIGGALVPMSALIAYSVDYITPTAALVVAGVSVGATVVACKLNDRIKAQAAARIKAQQLLAAAQQPIGNIPAGFVATIDDGAKRALNAFPYMDAGPIARDLDGKSLGQIKAYMDSTGATRTIAPLPPHPSRIIQTKWELPDGTVVRVKETVPPGLMVDQFRREPSLSIGVVKRDANGQLMPETYQNEAFKVSSNGTPVPKGPNEVDTQGLIGAQRQQHIDNLMNSGHRSVLR